MRVQCRLLDHTIGDDGRIGAVELVGDADPVIAKLASGPTTVLLEPVGADVRVEAVARGVITDERGVSQLLIGDDPNAAAPVADTQAAGSVPWAKAVAVLLGVWAIVAAATSGLRPYWYDESWSLAFARLPFTDWAPLIRFGEINMVGYHTVLKGWTALVGTDEWVGRLPSVAAGVVAGVALYAVAARAWNQRIAFGAVVLFATSASMLDYAQQARAYSAATAATTLSMWVLLRWRDHPRVATLALWSVAAGIAATLHVFAAFCIAGQLLGAFAAGRRRFSLLVAGAAAAVLVAPVGYYLAFGTGGGTQVDWIPDPTWRTALDVAELVTGGRGLLAAAAVAALAGAGLRRNRAAAADVPTDRFARWAFAGWVAVPVSAALVMSAIGQPLVVARYFLPMLPAIAILAAAGARRSFGDLWAGPIAVLALVGVLYQAELLASRPTWDGRAAAETVAAQVQTGDGLVVVPFWSRTDLEWHLAQHDRDALDALVAISPAEPIGAVRPAVTLGPDDDPEVVAAELADLDRVWVAQVQGEALPDWLQQELLAFSPGAPEYFAAYEVRLFERIG